MTRRRWLLGAAGVALGSLTAVWPQVVVAQGVARETAIAAWRGRLQRMLDSQRLPLIDIEATYVGGRTNIAYLMERMDALDVAQIAFAPANAANSQPALDLHRDHPAYFIPTSNSGEFPRWWTDPLAFLTGVRTELQSGRYFLMGEHEFRHYPSPEQVAAGQTFRDITIALDGPAGHALFQLGEETGVPFQLHYEVEDRLLPALEAMLTRYPRAKVIWCHAGMVRYAQRATTYSPDFVRSLIERHPGLHFDLAVPAPDHIYQPSGERDSTLYREGQLDPRWRTVLEQHADRFLAGSDYRPPIEQEYTRNIQRLRSLVLDTLSEPSRHLIAYGNAWRLLTGTSWSPHDRT
jgi:hypothetical protein